MYRITYNLSVDWYRKAKKEIYGYAPDDNLVDQGKSAEQGMQQEQISKIVADEINTLPERQRAALVLTYYERLSNAEVAEVMGTTVKSVEALLVRARKKLKKKLSKFKGVL